MIGRIRDLGGASSGLVERLGQVAVFGGELVLAIPRPPFRIAFFMRALFDAGVLSVALICLSGFTVGMVLGLQLYTVLTRFGAAEGISLESMSLEEIFLALNGEESF